MFREGTNHGMGWGGGTEVLRSRGGSEAVVRAFTQYGRFRGSVREIFREGTEPWHGIGRRHQSLRVCLRAPLERLGKGFGYV